MMDALLTAVAPNRSLAARKLPLSGGTARSGAFIIGALALGALAGFVAMRRRGQRRAHVRPLAVDDLFIKRLRQSGEF